MNAVELRVGNLVISNGHTKNVFGRIVEINNSMVAIKIFNCKTNDFRGLEQIKPIKLTKRLFLKNVIIEKEVDPFLKINNEWCIAKMYKGSKYAIYHGPDFVSIIEFVHELQNWVSLLTKKEFTFIL